MTYINPRTGKGWTDAEEITFAGIMHVGRMERANQAIQLWARCKLNTAVPLVLAEYGKATLAAESANATRAANLKRLRKARLPVGSSPTPKSSRLLRAR